MNKNFLTYIFLCFCFAISAQEGLKPLTANINYLYGDLQSSFEIKAQTASAAKTTTNTASLQLPFIDDFSYSPTQKYPNQTLWDDSLVYVNSGFAIAPPSIGVATFDGLNKHGFPYEPTLASIAMSRPADTLTSKPINLYTVGSVTLQPIVDSVALSFYYQARGYGDSPELNDSLILDFYKPNQQVWEKRVWFSKGNSNPNIKDTVFKRAFIWVADSIIDTAYLQDGFRFRFRNSASTAGSFDHWHIDYVYLNRNRTIVDTVYNDQTIEMIPRSFLKNYSAMPRQQFTTADTIGRTLVRIRNNFTDSVNMNYNYKVYDKNNVQVHNAYPSGNSGQVPPYKKYGVSTDPNLSKPVTYSFAASFADTSDFTIKHYIYRELGGGGGGSVDFIPQNDTVIQYQRFRNYYAFDDGSAEAGYYVDGAGSMMAVKIVLNKPDTLRAARIYFDPAGSINTATASYNFSLCVWEGSSVPTTLRYMSNTALKPKYYNEGFKEIPEYQIIEPLILTPGTYFVGIKQAATTITVAVGFDMNNDFHTSTYYNIGTGGWQQSEFAGALMIRPVLGEFVPPPVGIKKLKIENEKFKVYPNPSSDYFIIQSLTENEISSYQLINSLGQKVKEENVNTSEYTVNTSELSNGVYFLLLTSNKTSQSQKIIISR